MIYIKSKQTMVCSSSIASDQQAVDGWRLAVEGRQAPPQNDGYNN